MIMKPKKLKPLSKICENCGAKRKVIGGRGPKICPANCDSQYNISVCSKKLKPIDEPSKIDLIRHEDMRTGDTKGYYWLMDDYFCGWLCSKTYQTKHEAVLALARNKTEWVEEELKMK